ncbi:Pkinase-domain-containing protein [Peniophora sp. CONT]|nr:Pkinase-domain-containing protein [Peniophora sp. CONT]
MGAVAAGGASGIYKHQIPSNFPPPPRDPPPSPPREPYGGRVRRSRRNLGNGSGASTNGHSPDSSWADRPNPEDVIDRLEQWFPNHDVDKPVIESSSGGTSPTAAIAPPVPAAPIPPHMVAAQKRGHKKSIRVVAEEHKQRISRIGRGVKAGKDGMQGGFASDVARKRSTKLWDSKVEEVTPGQIRAGMPSITPESPAGTATAARKPIFKWVRGELIGKGNFGRVYLAMNVTTGEMIAVKQVEIPRTASDRSDARQANVVDALKLESETLKDLDHPNIVQYLGFEETPTFLSIFLEYVPGGSVGGILRKYGRFDEDVTKSFTSQILAGLEYLHSKGILHRDMKADNVLVEQTGICKISDFGISKRTEDINEAAVMTAMQGTVFWMAPEVVNTGKRGYNSKVDIWSVGCVVLEMWAGERPWRELEAMAVIVKLYSKGQAPPVPQGLDLSDLAEEFRKLCFAVDPDKRPTAAELRKHPYLMLPPDWTFTGFTHRDNALEEAEKF